MANPFKYGTVVSGKDFADRQSELKELEGKRDVGERLTFMGDRIRPAALEGELSCQVKVADPPFLWRTENPIGYRSTSSGPEIVKGISLQASRVKYQALVQMTCWVEGIDLASYV
jgi:hypothetical protein